MVVAAHLVAGTYQYCRRLRTAIVPQGMHLLVRHAGIFMQLIHRHTSTLTLNSWETSQLVHLLVLFENSQWIKQPLRTLFRATAIFNIESIKYSQPLRITYYFIKDNTKCWSKQKKINNHRWIDIAWNRDGMMNDTSMTGQARMQMNTVIWYHQLPRGETQSIWTTK